MQPDQPKTVVITGAAGGLGRALAKACFNRGFHLALLDIDYAGLESLKQECRGTTQTISIHHCDISGEEGVIAARLDILQHHKSIDMLINNAGISISQPFDQMSVADFRRLFEVNFWGMVYCTRHFLPDLRNTNSPHIANIISSFALMGFPGKTAYASSKSAIMGFTNALKTELSGSGMSVSLVIPPPLPTGIVLSGKHTSPLRQTAEHAFLEKTGMAIPVAADKIITQLLNGKQRIVIGTKNTLIDLAARLFPTMLHNLVARNKDRFDFV